MKIPVPDQIPAAADLGTVHFIGIGGAGLSAIARIMAARGVSVQGSDDNDTPFLPALRELGVPCHLGYDATNLGDAETVVVTTAAREDNPEYVAALERGLRVWPRSAGLASLMIDDPVLAVAGTHGKTTTTGLLTVALRHCGADPTYAVGGVLTATGRNADAGTGPWFVAEADESDGAFLVYSPFAAIITNVEADHLDYWGTPQAYHSAFEDFLDRIDPEGFVVCCTDDAGAARLASTARERGISTDTVGTGPDADLRAIDLTFAGTRTSFTVLSKGAELGRVQLQIPGEHYVLDALAALATGLRLGLSFDDLAAGLAAFTGSGRRMESMGEVNGIRVFDSYAHAPTEIAGDLRAARGIAGSGRVIAAFQPHLVSRTRRFGQEMGQVLGAADQVVVLEIYLAREDADPEVTGRMVADAVPLASDQVRFEPDFDAVPELLANLARPGDVVLTLGAGTITHLAPRVVECLMAGEGRE